MSTTRGYRTGAAGRVGSMTGSAYLEVRRRILHLELPPGARFTEKAVAEELGMSKTPVREALSLLVDDGFAEVVPRSGYRVSQVTLRGARELFDVHKALEGGAMELAALRYPAGGVECDRLTEGLASAAGELEATIDADRWLDRYTQLHMSMAELTGNAHLRRLLSRALYPHQQLLRVCLVPGADVRALTGSDRPLLAALRERDPEAAREAVEVRLSACQERVMDALLSSDALLDVNIAAPPRYGF